MDRVSESRGGAAPDAGGLEPELLDVLAIVDDPQASRAPEPDGGGGVLSTPEAWSVAVFGPGRALRHADPRFTLWLADPSARAACLKLLDFAKDGDTRFGLVDMPGDGVIAICAAPAAVAAVWTPGMGAQLADPAAETALVAFAPSRSVDLLRWAAESFGLSPLEARLVEALLQAPTLQVAAERIGVGRETAKEALANAMRKVGVERATQLVSRVVDLICGAIEPAVASDPPPLAELTTAEARIAMALARGETAEAASRTLGLSVHTVKSHRKAIFSKLGINRARDLNRVMVELQELRQLTARSEVRPHSVGSGAGRLRVIATDSGRRVAMIDYGPASGRPIMVCHGMATGMRLSPAMVEGLHRRGYRPLSPQRPGFGLTDAARDDYLSTAADDMAAILARLGAARTTVLAREGGSATAFAFGATASGAAGPRGAAQSAAAAGPAARGAPDDRRPRLAPADPQPAPDHALLRDPAPPDPDDLLHTIFRRVYGGHEVDRACAERPEVRDHLVRDVQGLVARTSAGVAAEHFVYAEGWRIPAGVIDARWTMTYSDALWSEGDLAIWRAIAGDAVPLAGAGLLAHFTHAEALLDIL